MIAFKFSLLQMVGSVGIWISRNLELGLLNYFDVETYASDERGFMRMIFFVCAWKAAAALLLYTVVLRKVLHYISA